MISQAIIIIIIGTSKNYNKDDNNDWTMTTIQLTVTISQCHYKHVTEQE